MDLAQLAKLAPFYLVGILLGIAAALVITPLLAGSQIASLIVLVACVFLGIVGGRLVARLVLGR